jgi:hypothetical protein
VLKTQVSLPPQPRTLRPGKDTPERARARARLLKTLFDDDGRRKLPRERALVQALEACDVRDVWWVCEASSAGPVYLLPTVEWVEVFASVVDGLGAKSVLEVAAGDGFLASCLKRVRPRLRISATDDHSWRSARARQSEKDRRDFAGVPFSGIAMNQSAVDKSAVPVQRMKARAAVDATSPDLVVVSWAPPGLLVERCLRGPCRFVLDLGVDGDVCGNGAKTWRFNKEFLDGPLEERALCRLDTRPRTERHTRATLYFGARHDDHGVEERFG